MQKKIQVGIVYGGRSVEHDISIKSAINVIDQLDKNLFELTAIKIDKKGKWHIGKMPTDTTTTENSTAIMLDSEEPILFDQDNTNYKLDVIFPVLHGTDGEDGSIQGLLKTLNIPCVGSDVAGSAISMDKVISKRLLEADNIPVCKYRAFSNYNKDKISFEDLKNYLGLPFIAKPANLGSSIGISKIRTEADLENAIDEVFSFDKKALFEVFVEGREFECAILGNHEVSATAPGEIIVHDNYEFYDYEAKYQDQEATKLNIPACLEDKLKEKLKKASIDAYKALECKDFARVDLFLSKENKIYVNEINTIPGFTNISMFPALWKYEGIEYSDLLTKIIHLCLERSLNKVNRHFDARQV